MSDQTRLIGQTYTILLSDQTSDFDFSHTIRGPLPTLAHAKNRPEKEFRTVCVISGNSPLHKKAAVEPGLS